jgi:hypothetical protein
MAPRPTSTSDTDAATGGDSDELTLPEDLTTLDEDALGTARESYGAEIARIRDLEAPTAEDAARMAEVAAAYQALGSERTRRDDEAAATRQQIAEAAAVLEDAPADGETVEGDGTEGDPAPVEAPADAPAEAPAEAAPVSGELVAASANRWPAVPRRATLNRPMSLADIAGEANGGQYSAELAAMGIHGTAAMPSRPASAPEPPELVINAEAGVPGMGNGERIETNEALAAAFMDVAGGLGVTRGAPVKAPVASMRRSYAADYQEMPDPRELQRVLREIVNPTRTVAGMSALVAAGGWCAPSEIRYQFFDISGGPTVWDAPQVGINRGGLRWPISLSLAGFFGISGTPPSGVPSAATMPWLWTEADDLATITGSGAKLCLRPPCPSFDERRLEAFGICVLNGNFADEAYPELIRHFLGLTTVAHERVMNRRHLALAAAGSTAVTLTTGDVGASTSAILGGTELLAIHEREKFGMPPGAVIEAVFPSWLRGNMRSDLTKRMGFNDLAVTDAYLMSLFDARNIRAQFVSDWQTLPGNAGPANTIGAATAPTAWPTTVQSLVYAPGTWFKGRGLRIDLGLIRDSVLNAENDHTAAWSEEGSLVGMFGHESLLATHNLCASGETGGQIAVETCGV